jgi:hypothetical protein
MSVRFVSPDLEPVFMVYFLCPISRDYVSFYITIQPRLTIFGLHIDHGGYMPEGHVSLNIESFFIFYLRQVFVIRISFIVMEKRTQSRKLDISLTKSVGYAFRIIIRQPPS